ncbi:MAG: DUF1874 domain-containing protein [Candidatus Bilamarchaeaceae archaeon]
MKIFNSVSLNMLNVTDQIQLNLQRITPTEARQLLLENIESFIGHQDTANIISKLLNLPIPFNRSIGTIQAGEKALIAQYIGPRLPEGSKTLPDGARIDFFILSYTNL